MSNEFLKKLLFFVTFFRILPSTTLRNRLTYTFIDSESTFVASACDTFVASACECGVSSSE